MVCIIAVSCIFYDHRFSSFACTKPGNRTVMYVCLGVFCLYQARKQNGHVCVFGDTERHVCVFGVTERHVCVFGGILPLLLVNCNIKQASTMH